MGRGRGQVGKVEGIDSEVKVGGVEVTGGEMGGMDSEVKETGSEVKGMARVGVSNRAEMS